MNKVCPIWKKITLKFVKRGQNKSILQYLNYKKIIQEGHN